MGDALPIGRALPGYTAYVIDQKGRQVSDGETGELCIGGGALAVGYLNRPEQTRSAFIACLLYTSPSPRDRQKSRMPSSA